MKILKRAVAAAVLAALPVASAQAACWSPAAEDAARIRDMETMLMVSALRCRLTGEDFLKSYNGFVKTSRPALVRVNDTLRQHFAGEGGLNAYDRYVTSIANRYGAGTSDMTCGDMSAFLDAARAEKGSYDGLSRLALAARVKPVLAGGRCKMALAKR